MYKKWAGRAFALNNFILITIRSGIGTGIFQDGQLIRGAHGMAGELSHLPIQPDGKRCRCGKFGCLETLVNRDILYRKYVERILKNAKRIEDSSDSAQDHQESSVYLQRDIAPTDADVKQGLAVLFSLAKQGHDGANAIIQDTAKHLGMAIATLLLLFDISHLFLAGTFGPDGDILIPALQQEIDAHVLPGTAYTITYTPLEHLGFAHGAALLVLEEFFTQL
jgi:transcriptional regulator of PTS gene